MLVGFVQAEVLAKVSKVQKEKDFLQQTSESLLRNQDDFRTQLAAEQAAVRAKEAQITDLTEQVSPASWLHLLRICMGPDYWFIGNGTMPCLSADDKPHLDRMLINEHMQRQSLLYARGTYSGCAVWVTSYMQSGEQCLFGCSKPLCYW